MIENIYTKVIIAAAVTLENTYFIFRDSGQEVRLIVTEGAKISSNCKLFDYEIDYIKNYIKGNDFF